MKAHKNVIHPQAALARTSGFARFNEWLAIQLGNKLGSMGFFYVCAVLDLVELPPVIAAANVITWINYVAQTVIQLIALPIISTQQNIQQKLNDAKADVDHHAITYLATLQDEQLAILKDLQAKK